MNFFCRLFGHTWWPETRSPRTTWNTTKDGNILVVSFPEEQVVHVDVCKRCGEERSAASRRHDADRPGAQPEAVDGSF